MSTKIVKQVRELEDEDDSSLSWTMSREIRDGADRRSLSWKFELTSLTAGYSTEFLVALKWALIERRNRVSVPSIHRECQELKSLMLKCVQSKATTEKIHQIDHAFLSGLTETKDSQTKDGLKTLARFFQYNRGNGKIFAPELQLNDFPSRRSVLGDRGESIKRILSQALSRAVLAQTLTAVEEAYEVQDIGIAHYSFAMLAFQVFWRPSSYRQLRLKDLTRDEDTSTGQVSWFLDMFPAKTRADNPERLAVKITNDLGEILKLQQEHVVQRYGHLVPEPDLGKLALFPAMKLRSKGTWISDYAASNYGMLESASNFRGSYLAPINQLVRRNITFNALRHTVGTQLALTGLPASRIAAVLKHADDTTCQKYVDLFFQGVLDRISDAMQPSFDDHFPVHKDVVSRVISKHDKIPIARTIVSEDLLTGRREVTAACGRESICGYAPLACYDCSKFRPCWDADHTINLDVVNREIAEFEGQGLAMQHEAQKFKQLKSAIRVVISICELKSQTVGQGAPK